MKNTGMEELIDNYGKKVYNLAFRITGSREDAEDVTQETFIQVFQSINRFKGDSQIYTWIYKIALNNCLKLKKKLSQAYVESLDEKVELFKDDIPVEVQEWYSDPEKAIYINELLAEIRHGCLHFLSFRLPEKQRIVYIMRNVLGFSYQEISAITGINENVVKARLNRARTSLMEYFSQRCQWIAKDYTCNCHTRIGFALAYDPEILKKVKAQAVAAGLGDKAEIEAEYRPHIDELYQKFPTIEYWGKNILKEKIGQS